MRYIHLKTAALALGLLFACATTTVASVVQGQSILLSPTSKQLKLDAGTVKTGSFTILNNGTEGYSFKVYAAPYSVANGSYTPNFSNEVANADIHKWVRFDKTEYHLEPDQKAEVAYTIDVPSDAAPGGHYGILFAETQSTPGQGGIKTNKRVGAILYTTVNGDYIEAGKEVETAISGFQIGYPLQGRTTIENTGNTDFAARSIFRVHSIFGGTLYEEDKEFIILPKTTRDIPLTWHDGNWLGWYNVEVQTTVFQKTTTHNTLVFIAPAWFIIVAAVVVAGAFYWFVWRPRR